MLPPVPNTKTQFTATQTFPLVLTARLVTTSREETAASQCTPHISLHLCRELRLILQGGGAWRVSPSMGRLILVIQHLLYSTVLYCILMSCTVINGVYCNIKYYTVFYCTVLYLNGLYSHALYFNILYCTVLNCTALKSSELK